MVKKLAVKAKNPAVRQKAAKLLKSKAAKKIVKTVVSNLLHD